MLDISDITFLRNMSPYVKEIRELLSLDACNSLP